MINVIWTWNFGFIAKTDDEFICFTIASKSIWENPLKNPMAMYIPFLLAA